MAKKEIQIIYRSIFSLIVIFHFGSISYAQENINTERPTLSIGSWVVPENSFQYEQGAFYLDGPDDMSYDAFFRVALSKSTEIRVLVPTLRSNFAVVGMKWMMIKAEGTKPGLGFLINVASIGDGLRVSDYRVVANKVLSDNLEGFVNIGNVGGGFFGDVTLALSLSDRLSITGEYWHHEDWQQTQYSLIFLINSETQIDINGGLLFNTSSTYTIGVGFAKRFKMKYTRDDE